MSGSEGTQSIHRAVETLRIVAQFNPDGARLIDLTEATGLKKPTVHRILKGLIETGLVQQPENNKRYFLGPTLYALGASVMPRFDFQDFYEPAMERIVAATEETVFLVRRSDRDAVCIARHSGTFPIKVFILDVGVRRPMGIGAGSLAMLSAMPEEEAFRIIENNADRFGQFNETPESVHAAVNAARDLGYVSRDVARLGIRTVSVPIRNMFGSPFSALSVSSILPRMEVAEDRIVTLMRKEVESVEVKLAEERFVSF